VKTEQVKGGNKRKFLREGIHCLLR